VEQAGEPERLNQKPTEHVDESYHQPMSMAVVSVFDADQTRDEYLDYIKGTDAATDYAHFDKASEKWVRDVDFDSKAEIASILQSNPQVRTLSLYDAWQDTKTPGESFHAWSKRPQVLYRVGTPSGPFASYSTSLNRSRDAAGSLSNDELSVLREPPIAWMGAVRGAGEILINPSSLKPVQPINQPHEPPEPEVPEADDSEPPEEIKAEWRKRLQGLPTFTAKQLDDDEMRRVPELKRKRKTSPGRYAAQAADELQQYRAYLAVQRERIAPAAVPGDFRSFAKALYSQYHDQAERYAAQGSEELGHASATENGIEFTTGQPVRFPYIHNTEPSPRMGVRFGQDLEPHGRYIQHHSNPDPAGLPPNLESGEIEFQNPLVIAHAPDDIYGPNGWKARLSRAHGGLTGKRLSKALAQAGHDGIVTVDPRHGVSSEIVDLTMFHRPKAERYAQQAATWHHLIPRPPETLYHGTRADGDITPGAGANLHSQGIWLTTNPKNAREYADFRPEKGHPRVVAIKHGIANPAYLSAKDALHTTADELKTQGHDSAYIADAGYWVLLDAPQHQSTRNSDSE
jgi:hypothetical protein